MHVPPEQVCPTGHGPPVTPHVHRLALHVSTLELAQSVLVVQRHCPAEQALPQPAAVH
jgi:hypothetical protein